MAPTRNDKIFLTGSTVRENASRSGNGNALYVRANATLIDQGETRGLIAIEAIAV
jgi:hypothetical protein